VLIQGSYNFLVHCYLAVEVTNIQTGITEQFSTLTDAASFLGVSRTTVKNVVKSGKIFRDIYSIKLKD